MFSIYFVICLFCIVNGLKLELNSECNESNVSNQNIKDNFVIYEVNFEIEKDVANDYMIWLKGHLDKMITEIDGFISYKINSFERVNDENDIDTIRRVIQWKLRWISVI